MAANILTDAITLQNELLNPYNEFNTLMSVNCAGNIQQKQRNVDPSLSSWLKYQNHRLRPQR